MAGPIIEALRRMRANTEARVAYGGGMIRNMLGFRPPVAHREAMAPLAQYIPDHPDAPQDFGVFHSLGGVRTANHAMKGMPVSSPMQRQMQQDPAGPDTTPDRAYDGDGNVVVPTPVRGETEALPAPPAARPTGLMAEREAAARAVEQARQRLDAATGGPDILKAQSLVVAAARQQKRVDELLAAEQAAQKNSMAGIADELEVFAKHGLNTGDWSRHGLAAKRVYVERNPKTGESDDPMFLDTYARQMAAPAVLNHLAQVFADHGTLNALSPQQQAAAKRSLAYIFPLPPDIAKDERRTVDWWRGVVSQLNSQYNGHGDPDFRAYLETLATAARTQQQPPKFDPNRKAR